MIWASLCTAGVIAAGLIALQDAWAGLKRGNTYFIGFTFDRARMAVPYWIFTSALFLIATFLLLLGLVLAFAIYLKLTI